MVDKDRKIPIKIVCVHNKMNEKDWIVFICTNLALSEEETMSILVNPEIIPILSGFHSSIIRTRKRPALVLISDTKLLCKNDYKTISAA